MSMYLTGSVGKVEVIDFSKNTDVYRVIYDYCYPVPNLDKEPIEIDFLPAIQEVEKDLAREEMAHTILMLKPSTEAFPEVRIIEQKQVVDDIRQIYYTLLTLHRMENVKWWLG